MPTVEHKQIAKITKPFLGFEEGHGIFTAGFTADFGGSTQSVGGYNLAGDTGFAGAFIRELLKAAGVDSWDKLDGKVVQIIQAEQFGPAIGIENLPFERGGRFIFDELAATYRARREQQ
ncbi:hypothetical protein CHO01_31910 [Cellulomonas hominis]|uniref:Uncharacterized protein n=1 Tax=Cellulomonas hominis TaxID=156981 RepID=A0A511FFQ1_9CELL|nr:hypothetical protein [Cellulomonas hominis]MBB5474851.1 hypothetical protein [Cellulomonas hominis]NKY05624.1 hypothetical protein [Cellulomonas hominis]GEL48075.1 hypothetical protein CHO01_31910 [Cellulomonas hominis]